MREDFINEPYLNMSDPAERQMMQDAIDFVGKNLGKHYDIFVGGKAIPTPGKIISYNPSKKDEVVGSTVRQQQRSQNLLSRLPTRPTRSIGARSTQENVQDSSTELLVS